RPMAVLPLLVMVSSLLTVQGLYGLRKQHLAPYLGFAVAFAGLTLNLLLIPTYGTEGAVWAWITSQVCEILIATTILIILRRRTHLQKIHTEP
ncbi:MAG: polysaccharide biosynthesis C-terminal domain-containing protein, partial [Muribaculaceae bacterium]|nr:polysaccharide biosynthesis C-terminal domain-containing protein [Muribaculaceae bacterium]